MIIQVIYLTPYSVMRVNLAAQVLSFFFFFVFFLYSEKQKLHKHTQIKIKKP